MFKNSIKQKLASWYHRSRFRFDVLLFVFLLVGWSLIFTTATLGLYRIDQQWLPVGLVARAAADYSVNSVGAPKLARIDPEIIEAVKQDQVLRATPTPPAMAAANTATPTLEPTLTPTNVPSALEVSAGGPYSGEEGSEIEIVAKNSGSVLGLVPGAISYVWDLDNDGYYDDADGASTSVTFLDEGDYPIGVQATDLLGQVAYDTATVMVDNVPPVIVMGNDITGKENQEVAFLATASDPGEDILLYEWDFGDGSPKVTDTLNPVHTYIDDGDFLVRLRVRDNDGGVTEASMAAEVENLSPLVNAGANQVTTEGSEVVFTGSASDPSPADPLFYDWDFDYDGSNFDTDASGETASTVYPNGPVSLIVALRVRDKDDGETIDTIRVMVNNMAPVITGVSDDGPVGEGSPLSLSISATDVGNDSLSYAFDWQNDGSFDDVGQPDTVSNIWYNQGNHTVRIRVDDGDGGQAFTTTTVATFNEPPVAIVNADTNRLEGSPLAFDGSDSSDPGIKDILTYQWAFGDGGSGTGVNTTHTYGDNGVYSATLTVTDDSGDFSNASAVVNILNANPTANAGSDLIVDECRKNGSNYECANVPVNFSGTATDPGTADILTYAWDFDGDGSFADAAGPIGTYLYPSLDGPKDYIITLRVRDDDYNPNPAGGNEIGEAVDTLKLTVKNLPPWNVNAGGPYVGVETQQITLIGNAEDAPADTPTLEYAWDLNSNPDFEVIGKQITRVWNEEINRTIRLRVRDKDGGEAFASALLNITNALPNAEANGPYTSTVNFPITLSSAGSSDPTNDPLIYRWDFGDGSPLMIITNSAAITVTHSYTDDRAYSATLTVDDQRGGTDIDTALVTITNLPPDAVASASSNSVTKGVPIIFNGSGSTDPDDNPANLNYQWNFGDGTTGASINVNKVYSIGGTYNVVLTVSDDNGASDTAPLVVTVNNSVPIAAAGADQTVNEGGQLTFNGSGSTDPDPGDLLTYQWDFGDGSALATGVNVNHIFADGPAVYNVTLTVTDSDGAVGTDTLQVTVNNVAPIAAAGPDQTVNEGSPITFNGSGSGDAGADTLTYQWDFGDGSPAASGVNVTHTYPDGPASYVVTLTVTDSDGGSSTDTAQVTVNNVAPTARAAADQTTVTVGQVVNFDASGSTDPGNDGLTYLWDFGDGSTDNGPTVSYSWTITGTYTIILQVEDDDGQSDTDNSVSVQVN